MIADFDTSPMSANQVDPIFRGPLFMARAADEIAQLRFSQIAFATTPATYSQKRERMGEITLQSIGGTKRNLTTLQTPMTALIQICKKGVS